MHQPQAHQNAERIVEIHWPKSPSGQKKGFGAEKTNTITQIHEAMIEMTCSILCELQAQDYCYADK